MQVYSEQIKGKNRTVKILGITTYKSEFKDNEQEFCCETKYFGGLFKTIENKKEKNYYFLGLPVRKDVNPIDYQMLAQVVSETLQYQLSARAINAKTFEGFKNINKGKSVVLLGAGPTMKYFNPIEGALNCALNRTVAYDKVKFDYIFFNDNNCLTQEAISSKLFEYSKGECVKFIGDNSGKASAQVSETLVNDMENARRYKTNIKSLNTNFALDLENDLIGNFKAIALQAIQFLLYTNPEKIYLVGIDSSLSKSCSLTSFGTNNQNEQKTVEVDKKALKEWTKLKEFASIYYPETQIISINPVGLRGLFEDVYTKEYMKEFGLLCK